MDTLSTFSYNLLLCLWVAFGIYMLAGEIIRGVVFYFGKGDGVMGRLGNFIELSTQRGSLIRELDMYAMASGLRPNIMKAFIMMMGLIWIYVTAAVLGGFEIGIDPPFQTTIAILLAIGLGSVIEEGKIKYFTKVNREVNQRLAASEPDFTRLSQIFGDVSNAFHKTEGEIQDYTSGGLLQGNAYINRLNKAHDNLNLLDNGFRYGMWSALDGAMVSIDDYIKKVKEDAQVEIEEVAIDQALETEEGAHKFLETGVDVKRDTVRVKSRRARKRRAVLAKLYHEDHNQNAIPEELEELKEKLIKVNRAYDYLKSIY